ncbi:1,4-dihydroxy-2-naphthoate octaprenyltransferase [Bifidobacterium sp. 64T4]|uniref:1,4-dihydroxy-2-naphthoate octaprenyltransferase n=1 Tax=Bifidobacterium pongonis TaxID=2834432 RepID=UPI001C566D47|nr:1,4-dihydroxy-2-naphthoate octaprenyltransferase [Bifidobacterium pongonis]MBW3094939.1 1,4-dihydroxy-2-naphthoate octaprenyltransferase [Bifidobacterium pongonis]
MGISTWVRGARPRTLPLAIAPVMIGAALAWRDAGEYRIVVAVLCACVALFLQIAANFANDYSDGIRGTDEGRAVPPESTSNSMAAGKAMPSRGPARLVASGVNPRKVLAAAGVNALIACLCGLAVIALTGYWWFILVGIACLLAGWFYVGGKHPYGYRYLGEIFVFVFFGLVATCGTMFALTGTISPDGLIGGTAAGLIAVTVLCVNNLRDIESDREHGKHTWMTALGRQNGTVLAIIMLLMSALLTAYCLLGRRTVSSPVPEPTAAIIRIVMFAVLCVAQVTAVRAIAKRKYGSALPLCSLDSLAVALIFVVSSALA